MQLTKNTIRKTIAVLALAGASQASAQVAPAGPAPAVPQAEVSDIATMPATTSRWVYVLAGFGQQGVRVFDGESGKMQGTVQVANLGAIGLDPLGRNYYVAETMWSKVTRGTRQDMVTVYDAKSLKLVTEIAIPGRLLGGTNLSNFAVSSNGKLAFVYNMTPSSSVEVVDLEKRKHQQTVQLPGCAALFPNGADGVSALCADGAMATIAFAAGKATVTRSAPFFPAATDPVYDEVVVDHAGGTAVFLSYTGKVYSVTLGATPQFAPAWSLQAAAGLHEAAAAPLDVNWIPGGRQPFAVNHKTGRLYVLMHVGEQYTHKEAGEEIWVVDMASHKVVARHATPGKVTSIQVSQEATPLVYVSGDSARTWILDGATLEPKYTLEHTGGGNLFVPEPA